MPAADRPIARALWERLDEIEGFPRTLAESEITRIGPASQRVPAPYTETLFTAYVHDDTGAAALHGAVALTIDEPPEGLMRRRLTYNGTTRTLREWVDVGIANRGWQIRDALPGVAEAWSLVAPRDGEAGSADGVLIAEGAE